MSLDAEAAWPTPAAEIMKSARQIASITYSGQCAERRFMIDPFDDRVGQEVSRRNSRGDMA